MTVSRALSTFSPPQKPPPAHLPSPQPRTRRTNRQKRTHQQQPPRRRHQRRRPPHLRNPPRRRQRPSPLTTLPTRVWTTAKYRKRALRAESRRQARSRRRTRSRGSSRWGAYRSAERISRSPRRRRRKRLPLLPPPKRRWVSRLMNEWMDGWPGIKEGRGALGESKGMWFKRWFINCLV